MTYQSSKSERDISRPRPRICEIPEVFEVPYSEETVAILSEALESLELVLHLWPHDAS